MPKVLVIGFMHEDGLALARARNDIELEIIEEENVEAYREKIKTADAVAVRTAPLRAEVLDQAENLKIVARHGVGYDSVDVEALTRRGIPLAIAVGGNDIAVAEHTLSFMLALSKASPLYDRASRAGDWNFRNSMKQIELAGRTVLILGLGRIGRKVAKRCQGLEMKTLAYDPYITEATIREHSCEPVTDLNAGLAQADVVTLHFPGGGDNVKFIDQAKLACLQPTAMLINCARGDIVDEAALYQALKSGGIRGAGLDVFEQEPAPASNPLFTLDNVIISPHSAALSQESAVRMSQITIANILDALDGKLDPIMVVNQEVL